MKHCSSCGTTKSKSEFYVDKSKSSGFSSFCKPCRKEASAKRYNANKDEINLKRVQAHAENPEKKRACSRAHWARHKAKRNAGQKERHHKKYRSDIQYRLGHIMRGMLSRSAKLAYGTKAAGQIELIGYTTEQLFQRISAQLKDGMTWDNFGEWHIDHKKPIRRFIEQGTTDFAIINALSNLQPLWAKDNWVKGNKFNPIERLP